MQELFFTDKTEIQTSLSIHSHQTLIHFGLMNFALSSGTFNVTNYIKTATGKSSLDKLMIMHT
jgi:hypothetical protein